MDVYKLINSNSISSYCRRLNYQFNITEIAVLIYRNLSMNIEEKISAYNELIREYEDMFIVRYSYWGPYEIKRKPKIPVEELSTKKQIIKEIRRLKELYKKLILKEENCFYTTTTYWQESGKIDCNNYDFIRDTFGKTYNSVLKKIKEIFKENYNRFLKQIEYDKEAQISFWKFFDSYEYISEFSLKKIAFNNAYKIDARYVVDEKRRKPILNNIIDLKKDNPFFENLYVYMPTPFKKGDLLYSRRNARFEYNYIGKDENVFVLNYKSNCEENMEEPEYDSIYCIEGGDICLREIWEWDYDYWEYFDGEPELKGLQRILKGVSSLLKDEVDLELFMQAYTKMKLEKFEKDKCRHLDIYEKKTLKKLGFNDEDIKKMKGGNNGK